MSTSTRRVYKISAVLCIILGVLRLLACLGTVAMGHADSFLGLFALLVFASVWQIFAGILGLACINSPEKASSVALAAVMPMILDGAFVFSTIFMFFWWLALLWALPYSLVFLGGPAVLAFAITSANFSKSAKKDGAKPAKKLRIGVISAAAVMGVALVFVFANVGLWFIQIMRENTPLSEVIPYGVWESHDPPITLFIVREYEMPERSFVFPALYEDTKIFVEFYNESSMIGRYRANYMRISVNHRGSIRRDIDIGSWHCVGDGFEIIDDTLHMRTSRRGELTFFRVENYPPLDLSEWHELSR